MFELCDQKLCVVDIVEQLRGIESNRPDSIRPADAGFTLGPRQLRHHRSQLILKRRDQDSRLGRIRIGHAHDRDTR